MEQTLCFSKITPALWDSMVEQARQDRYMVAKFRARVWMRLRGLL